MGAIEKRFFNSRPDSSPDPAVSGANCPMVVIDQTRNCGMVVVLVLHVRRFEWRIVLLAEGNRRNARTGNVRVNVQYNVCLSGSVWRRHLGATRGCAEKSRGCCGSGVGARPMGRGARHPPSLVRPISLLKRVPRTPPHNGPVPGRNDFRVLMPRARWLVQGGCQD